MPDPVPSSEPSPAPSPSPSLPSTETPKETTTPPAEPGSILLEKAAEPQKVVPETYADYKLPDGFELIPEVATEANKMFKAAGLSQEQAQEFVNFYVAKSQESFDQPVKAWLATQEEWKAKIRDDPEIGGANLDKVRVTVARAVDGLGDPQLAKDFREAMVMTGA